MQTDKSAARQAWEKQCEVDGTCPDCFKKLEGDTHICKAANRKTMKHLGDIIKKYPNALKRLADR